MKRYVETNRWQDSWFIELSPYAKLLLSYLYDCCDEIGSIDLNYSVWESQLGMDRKKIYDSLAELQPALISDKKKKIFIKDFLKHQKKLPLRKGIEEDDWIILKLQSSLEKFNNASEILNILNNHITEAQKIKSEEKVNRKKVFVAPNIEEVKAFCYSENPNAREADIHNIYDYYVSCGWTVGKNKPMVDWHSAIRRALKNTFKKNISFVQPTRTETTLSVVNELKNNK